MFSLYQRCETFPLILTVTGVITENACRSSPAWSLIASATTSAFTPWEKPSTLDKNYSCGNLILTKNQVSEVLIRSQQNGFLQICQIQHLIIGNPRLHLYNIQHLVTFLSESVHYLPVHAFISQELHLFSLLSSQLEYVYTTTAN